MAELRRRLHGDDKDLPSLSIKQPSILSGSHGRWGRYVKAAQRLGIVAICAGLAFVGAVAWVVATERTPAFAAGEYVVSFGYESPQSCALHGLAVASAPQIMVDIAVLEPGIADRKLLQLRWEEIEPVVNTFVVIVEGSETEGNGNQPWIWDSSDTLAAPTLLQGTAWYSLLSKYSHKLVIVVVPRILLSGTVASSNPSAKAAGDRPPGISSAYSIAGSLASIAVDAGDQWHGGTAYMREMLRLGGATGLERAGVTSETVLIVGRTHEMPRAATLRLLQMCDTQEAPMVLATATYVLSFEFRKPNAFRHSPLVITAGALLAGKATALAPSTSNRATGVLRASNEKAISQNPSQPVADALAQFRTAGVRSLTDAGWTCEHCTRDWAKLEPAAASSLRGLLRPHAQPSGGKDAASSYRALYQALCLGEDPLGASRLWGLDIMLSAVGLPRSVREGGSKFAHLMPGRCEGGKGAARLWELMDAESDADRNSV